VRHVVYNDLCQSQAELLQQRRRFLSRVNQRAPIQVVVRGHLEVVSQEGIGLTTHRMLCSQTDLADDRTRQTPMNVAVAMKRGVMVQLARDRRRHHQHILSSLVVWYGQLSCSTSHRPDCANSKESFRPGESHHQMPWSRGPSLTTTSAIRQVCQPRKILLLSGAACLLKVRKYWAI
jgi:hypothetical protein